MSVILHGLAAVCAVLASKSLQNQSLFWAFIKKGGGKKGEKAKQCTQVSPVGILMHVLFLERASPLLIHGSQPGVIRVPPTLPPPDWDYQDGVGKHPVRSAVI